VEIIPDWLVRWPWVVTVLALLALTQLQLAPLYLTAWLILGVAIPTLIFARIENFRLLEAMVLLARRDR
jgi:hypothetical protein